MSLRRRSCNACFRSRRKCNLAYPICAYCEKTSKTCEYAYPPATSMAPGNDPLQTAVARNHMFPLDAASPAAEATYGTGWLIRREQVEARLGPPFSPSGVLGDLAPVIGFGRWMRVHEEMKDYPMQFAKQAETMFIHSSVLKDYDFPRPLRAAFGICSASLTATERSRPVMFKAIDAEIKELLATRTKQRTLVDDLVTLQAAVLYQTIRLYQGSMAERMTAEQQEFTLRSYALAVLRRADIELAQAARTWEMWILAESIRRTVVVVFKLYTMYWAHMKGRCFEIGGLHVLPVSMSPELWRVQARERFAEHPDPNVVLTHEDFVKMWNGKDVPGVDSFHDLLLLGCKRQQGETLEGWRECA